MNKNIFPYDIYERHRKISSYLKKTDEVLDVGGEMNHLSQFISLSKLVVANLNTGDIIIEKNKLPFNKNSFDIVTAIDVLEHVPENKRSEFINSLLNIARRKIILSFPVGTQKHNLHEKQLLKKLEKNNINVLYLKEHVKFGLPTREQIIKLTSKYSNKINYSGNILINKIIFNIYIFDPKIKYLRKLIYYLKQLFYLFTNKLLYLFLSSKPFSKNVIRAYVIIDK